MTSTGSKSLRRELASFAGFNRRQLQDLWRRLYGSDPPETSRQLLTEAVPYRLQVKALGGVNFSTRRALEKATEEIGSQRAKISAKGPDMGKGLILVREWRGETRQVTALEEGVQYRGKRYRSLSEVAREITGTRWSGPRFFGHLDRRGLVPNSIRGRVARSTATSASRYLHSG